MVLLASTFGHFELFQLWDEICVRMLVSAKCVDETISRPQMR